MRAGGGKAKGSAFEREVGKALSLWLTHGERPDIFARNVLSGGAFTVMEKAGKQSSRMPGDVMAAHPLGFDFLKRFSVECKHLKTIGLEAYLWDPHAGTALGTIIELARRQAKGIGLAYMVVAKQNQRDALVFVDGNVGDLMVHCLRKQGAKRVLQPMHHFVHKHTVCILRFGDMLDRVDPDILLGQP